MFEELVLQVFCINPTASCATMELAGDTLSVSYRAVDGNYAQCHALVGEGEVVGV